MGSYTDDDFNVVLRSSAKILGQEKDLNELLNRIKDKKIVMLGEASHGTHEYYTWRSLISRKLIEDHGFGFIGVEGDWPDCYALNRYIKGYPGSGLSAKDVMSTFDRWPTWMWANWEVIALMEWMKEFNMHRQADHRAGFFGLDVYSLWDSMEAVKTYLQKNDPNAMRFAERAFKCFQPFIEDEGQSYARATEYYSASCEQEVVDLLTELRRKLVNYDTDHELAFSAEQNALVMVNAERYYREMIKGGPGSWNIRDTHMMETLDRLLEFHGPNSKAIVWEHNTHVGDARFTDMADDGMVNIGQLAREKYGEEQVFIIGFASYKGSVIAGRGWGDPMQEMMVPKAITGSIEERIHEVIGRDSYFFSSDLSKEKAFLNPVPHRAIGVVYHPHYEHRGNYVPSIIPKRYDALIYIEESKALHPLFLHSNKHQVPETYPFGM